jgi:hypothetical protein
MPVATTHDCGRLANAIARRLAQLAVRAVAWRAMPVPAACPVTAMGLQFRNPLGLEAGFDRTDRLLAPLDACGFGAIEIGTVLPSASLAKSDTVAIAARNLARFRSVPRSARIGVNLGNRHDGFGDTALADYLHTPQLLASYADYLAVNLSARPSIARLKIDAEPCRRFLAVLCEDRDALSCRIGRRVPLAAKVMLERVSPTLLQGWRALGMNALIGVSDGLATIAAAAAWLGRSPLISVGGIGSGNDIAERMRRDANPGAGLWRLRERWPFSPATTARRARSHASSSCERPISVRWGSVRSPALPAFPPHSRDGPGRVRAC